MTFRARIIKGHDYIDGIDVELTRGRWRTRLDNACFTMRVGRDLLGFAKRDGRTMLAFEIYDDGSLGNPQRRRGRGQNG